MNHVFPLSALLYSGSILAAKRHIKEEIQAAFKSGE
jgi:hypothetical protein